MEDKHVKLREVEETLIIEDEKEIFVMNGLFWKKFRALLSESNKFLRRF